ncbi:MAG: hypothetical protein BRC26_04310, partial [Nanohaloarchaea archaeon QH_8_44_6]
MVFDALFAIGGDGILHQIFMVVQILSFLILPALLVFFPRIMIWQADRKLESALVDLEAYRNDTEVLFLDKFASDIEDDT